MSVTPGFIRALDELVRTDLQGLRDTYFRWLLLSTGVVVLGVLLEGPELIWEIYGLRKSRQSSISELETPIRERRTPKWIILLSLLGWLFVSVGVAGEGAFEALVSNADGLLQTFNNTLLSDISNRASKAEITALAFESQIADANRQVAEANRIAEGEKLARVKLELRVAPRRLTPLQITELAEALKSFGGSSLSIDVTAASGFEGTNLANDILAVLSKAHITNQGNQRLMDSFFGNVILKEGKNRIREANIIAKFLVKVGLSPVPVQTDTSQDDNELRIRIGSKP